MPATTPATPSSDESLLQPFDDTPEVWEREQERVRKALRGFTQGAVAHRQWPSDEDTAYLARSTEAAAWGWLGWNVLQPGPQTPAEIGVMPPAPSRMDLIARRAVVQHRPEPCFLLGKPIAAGLTHLTVTLGTVLAGVTVGLGNFGTAGLGTGAAAAYAVWKAPHLLSTWARRRRLRVLTDTEGVAALAPLAALHRRVHAAACEQPGPELEQAERLGHRVLWELAGLLRDAPTGPASAEQIAAYREAYEDTARQALEVHASAVELTRVVETPPNESTPGLPDATKSADQSPTLQALADATGNLAQLAAAQRYAAQRYAAQRLVGSEDP